LSLDTADLKGVPMQNREQKHESAGITPQPTTANARASTELSEAELKKVSGGKGSSEPSVSEIVVTKRLDKSSP
jgi:bacteriocin-like protein